MLSGEDCMPQYRIAWLPGDGVGVEVMDADAPRPRMPCASTPNTSPATSAGNSGARKATRFPARTIELLKNVDAALFGAITSKPVKAAAAELAPALQGKGLTYRSPIVRMRQMFDLYICLRPCKAYPGNPLNFKEGIDLVVFRENTEDLYAGVEFAPVPEELAAVAGEALAKPFAPFASAAAGRIRHLLQDQHAHRLGADRPRRLRVRAQVQAQEGHRSSTRPTSCAPPTGCSSKTRKRWRKDYPGHPDGRRQHRRH